MKQNKSSIKSFSTNRDGYHQFILIFLVQPLTSLPPLDLPHLPGETLSVSPQRTEREWSQVSRDRVSYFPRSNSGLFALFWWLDLCQSHSSPHLTSHQQVSNLVSLLELNIYLSYFKKLTLQQKIQNL